MIKNTFLEGIFFLKLGLKDFSEDLFYFYYQGSYKMLQNLCLLAL